MISKCSTTIDDPHLSGRDADLGREEHYELNQAIRNGGAERMHYRREIDGLRALAVLPVIFFHAGFTGFSGGYVGVDVFFVISGFLITSILLSEHEAGTFSLLKFYERRARRILPALFFVMLACLPFAWFWLLPKEVKAFSESLAAAAAFSSNIFFWHLSGYFDTAAELKPLLHTWSLAVEEQYYVFFPLFLMLTWRLGKQWVFTLLAIALLVSLAAAHWASSKMPAAAFYLLPTRGWELLLGGFVAIFLSKTDGKETSRIFGELGAMFGLALILCAIFIFDKETPFPSLYTLAPTMGTALIILCAKESNVAGRLLGAKYLVGIGLISYSAYLWHQPLFSFARHRSLVEPSGFLLGFLASLSIVLAYFTWRYVELPFRTNDRVNSRRILVFSLSGVLVFLVIGLSGHFFSDHYRNLWLSRHPAPIQKAYLLMEESARNNNYAFGSDGRHGDTQCRFNIEELTDAIERQIRRCHDTFGKGVMILGDSHAIDLFGLALAGSREPFIVGLTRPGCRPHTRLPHCQYERLLSHLEQNKGFFKSIIYEQAGFYLLRTSVAKGTREMFSSLPLHTKIDGVYVDEQNVSAVYEYLLRLAKHTEVLWFGSRIEPHISDKDILYLGCDYPYTFRPNQQEAFEGLDTYIETLVRRDNVIRFISQNIVFNYQLPRDFMTCNEKYWEGGDHLSAAGEAHFGARFDLISLTKPRSRDSGSQ